MRTVPDITDNNLSESDKSSFIVKFVEGLFGKLKEHALIIIIVLLVMYCQDRMYDKQAANYKKILDDREKMMIKHHNDEMAIVYKFTNEEKAILKEKAANVPAPEIQRHTTIIREVPVHIKEVILPVAQSSTASQPPVAEKKKKRWLFNK